MIHNMHDDQYEPNEERARRAAIREATARFLYMKRGWPIAKLARSMNCCVPTIQKYLKGALIEERIAQRSEDAQSNLAARRERPPVDIFMRRNRAW
jgi:hypothetical protein